MSSVFKSRTRKTFKPVTERMAESLPNIVKSADKTVDDRNRKERQQREYIAFQAEQAENARSFLEETRAYNEMKLQEIQAEKDRLSAEREAEKAKSAEADRLASDKRKARGKRRLALIKSGERSAEGLGTPNVGRKKLLGN